MHTRILIAILISLSFWAEIYGQNLEDQPKSMALDSLFKNEFRRLVRLREFDLVIQKGQMIQADLDLKNLEDSIAYGNILGAMQQAYWGKGDIEKAEEQQLRALAIFEACNRPNLLKEYLVDCHVNLGTINGMMGKFEKSLAYFEKARFYTALMEGRRKMDADIFLDYNEGLLHQKSHRNERAVSLFKAAIQKINSSGVHKNRLPSIYAQVATSYDFLDQLDSARTYLELGLYNIQDDRFKSKLLEKLALIEESLGDLSSGEKHIRESLRLSENTYGKHNSDPAIISAIYLRIKSKLSPDNITEEEVWDSFSRFFSPETSFSSIKDLDYTALGSPISIVSPMQVHIETLLVLADQGNPQAILKADSLGKWGLELYKSILEKEGNEIDLDLLKSHGKGLLASIIHTKYLLFQNTQQEIHKSDAFEIAEIFKSLGLNSEISSVVQESLPDSIRDKESQINAQIQRMLRIRSQMEEDAPKMAHIQDSIFAMVREKELFQVRVGEKFPAYKKRRASVNQDFFQSVKNRLPKDIGIVYYFPSGLYAYTMACKLDHSGISLYKLPPVYFSKTSHITNRLSTNLNNSKLTAKPEKNTNETNEILRDLFEKLIQPLEPLPPKLVIIPEGSLSYLPFEVLLDRDNSSLIQSHSISYLYAYSQLAPNKKVQNGILLGIAPVFGDDTQLPSTIMAKRKELGPLGFNIPEVKQIASLFHAKKIKGDQATKSNFYKKASRYNILHIASHAEINSQFPENSYIAFTGGDSLGDASLLYLSEIYNLDLDAEMVVLSACNTARSANRSAESQSLAHAFAYAGARSLVATCWPVDDKVHAELMVDFYKGLKDGLPKDEALRQAKLIAIDKGLEPYYWAAPIAYGDMRPIQFAPDQRPWFLAGLLLLILLGTLGLRKKMPAKM